MKMFVKAGFILLSLSIWLAGCQTAENSPPTSSPPLATLSIPELSAPALENQPLKVVATTSVIGDIVGRISGDAVELTILIGAGQDSHSYEPSSGDLTAAANANVIFINGWNLEEGLLTNLENVSENGILIPISAGITPLPFGRHQHEDEQQHQGETADPHVWLDPHQTIQWVKNISQVLQSLDPDNAELYQQNAADYLTELQSLIQYYDQQVATIPVEKRVIVTNHDAFSYFASAYDFQIIGTVLPGSSTLSEPSAEELAALVETMKKTGVCTIFAETSANTVLAETISAELKNCENIQVITLYTESIGLPGSGDDSYIRMMQANIDAIISALNQT